ncbi:MAG: 4Fe-4S cluster-binding domain-containing protein [Elusimicrobia bacterium]|nr:4Fe-4S cluster-binding domain-containing protein [Elusimicrobiota bacterium]
MKTIKQRIKTKFPILVKIIYFLRAIILRNKLEFIEIHLVDSCNLKCKACTSFSNITTKANFIDARLLGIRLSKLTKLFTIEQIRLVGGEPLLHPDINNVLKIVRQCLGYSQIELVTNGILLNKMSKDFFETCYKNNINIIISPYPVLKNKEEIKQILSPFKINYNFFPMIFSFSANLNPKGNSNKEETFKNCRYTRYKTLKEDNIYTCPICAYIDQYNEYFNKNIPIGKGINIYTKSRKQIKSYLSEPEETCKYCTNLTKYIDWECSNTPKETDWNGNYE